ncbi:MAG: LamG domain-containing protein [Phycisphaerae bacterium]|nr:LamG domain-containing protein [Phycisphaerae bacterium]
MNSVTRLTLTLGMVVALSSGFVFADAAGDYETLFGADAKKIIASRTKTDDVEFAATLLKISKDVTDSPELQILLYEKAVQFGSAGVSGCDTAMEALGLLEKAVPAKKVQWRQKKLDIVKLRFTRSYGAAKKEAGHSYMEILEAVADAKVKEGDGAGAKLLYNRARSIAVYIKSPRAAEILAKSKHANAVVARQVRIKSLETKLKADARNTAVREELVLLYVVALDKPGEAAKLLTDDLDEVTRTYVPLAAKKIDDLDVAVCLELGDWYYRKLSKNASSAGKLVVLQRAKGYYERFCESQTEKNIQSLRAKMALDSIGKELVKLGASVRPRVPAGIILAMSFEKGQWTKAKDGSVLVKDVSRRSSATPLTARVKRGTFGGPGKTGAGLDFAPGSMAHLDIPAKATAGFKTFTFAFWVKTTESGSGKTYYRHPTFLGLNTGALGSCDYGITTSRGLIGYWSGLAPKNDSKHQSSSVSINDGKWHHIAMTNDGETMLLYVDAGVVLPKGLPTGQSLTTMSVPLGASRTDTSGYPSVYHHSGTYDELQLYNRALTAKEISTISGLKPRIWPVPKPTKSYKKPTKPYKKPTKPYKKPTKRSFKCSRCGKKYPGAAMLGNHYKKSPRCHPRKF